MLKIKELFLFFTKKYTVIRFVITGGLSTLLDYFIYWVMLHFVTYNVAMPVGYFLSLIFNYMLTTKWTFRSIYTITSFIAVVGIHLFNCFIVRDKLLGFFVAICGFGENEAYLYTIAISIPVNYLLLQTFFVLYKHMK
ncbi:MAG: hypothetical protein E7088_00470 [Bacteroidales bacterium]|nr:hypothetical protein [Bacteroidales bacterium]